MADPLRIGLIINPLAGIGGRLATHGSDHFGGLEIALDRGGSPVAEARAERALRRLRREAGPFRLLTADGVMGGRVADLCGIVADIACATGETTTAEDTRRVVEALVSSGIDMLLFAGGDGTARDIYGVTGDRVALVGIPAGVKMHSAVFALSPEAAGETAAAMTRQPEGRPVGRRLAEIMDADETERARGNPSLRLFGHASVPDLPRLLQPAKGARVAGGEAAIAALGRVLAVELRRASLVMLGPGTTMQAIKAGFGFEGSLLGVDVVLEGSTVLRDVDAFMLERLSAAHAEMAIVTGVVGQQGFVFGRGNQQISPAVLQACGRDRVIVVATREKLTALPEGMLHLDSGDQAVDALLTRYIRVRTGPGESMMMRLRAFV